eukprot:CFRG7085T1
MLVSTVSPTTVCPVFDLPFRERIRSVRCSPYKQSAGYMAIGGMRTMSVINLSADDKMNATNLIDFHVDVPVHVICWSPIASDGTMMRHMAEKPTPRIALAVACGDNIIRFYDNQKLVGTLAGHIDQINCLEYFPSNVRFLASSGDDCTLLIWNLDTGKQHASLDLTSPGKALRWGHDNTLSIAEACGTIRTYKFNGNLDKFTAVSVKMYNQPLSGCSWSESHDVNVNMNVKRSSMMGVVMSNGKWLFRAVNNEGIRDTDTSLTISRTVVGESADTIMRTNSTLDSHDNIEECNASVMLNETELEGPPQKLNEFATGLVFAHHNPHTFVVCEKQLRLYNVSDTNKDGSGVNGVVERYKLCPLRHIDLVSRPVAINWHATQPWLIVAGQRDIHVFNADEYKPLVLRLA